MGDDIVLDRGRTNVMKLDADEQAVIDGIVDAIIALDAS